MSRLSLSGLKAFILVGFGGFNSLPRDGKPEKVATWKPF